MVGIGCPGEVGFESNVSPQLIMVIAPDSVSPYPYPKLCFTFGKTIFDLLINSSGMGAPPPPTTNKLSSLVFSFSATFNTRLKAVGTAPPQEVMFEFLMISTILLGSNFPSYR